MPMPWLYQQIADDLRQAIERGDYPPGTDLPTRKQMAEQYGTTTTTIENAIVLLRDDGYVQAARGHGTRVLGDRPVRLPFTRYGRVLEPPGDLGPWETACAAQGIQGEMTFTGLEHETATVLVADALDIEHGDPVIRRDREARAAGRILQLQSAWYPAELIAGSALEAPAKAIGGAYRVLTAIGRRPATATETITVRRPTAEEITKLRRPRAVIDIRRITKDGNRTPVEYLAVTCDPARTVLTYDELPLA